MSILELEFELELGDLNLDLNLNLAAGQVQVQIWSSSKNVQVQQLTNQNSNIGAKMWADRLLSPRSVQKQPFRGWSETFCHQIFFQVYIFDQY